MGKSCSSKQDSAYVVVNWSPTLVDNIHFLVLPIVVHFTVISFKFLVPVRFLKKDFIEIFFRRCIPCLGSHLSDFELLWPGPQGRLGAHIFVRTRKDLLFLWFTGFCRNTKS